MSSKKIIYIAGKVTGLPDEQVKAKFKAVQNKLEEEGHLVINPFELVANFNDRKESHPYRVYSVITSTTVIVRAVGRLETWEECMRFLLRFLCTADEVHVMRCWQDSKGAILERDTAKRLGIPVHHI